MSNLWTTAAGRAAFKEAIYQIIRRRMSRFFGRNLVVQYNQWVSSGKTSYSFINTLWNLNEYHDTEILNLFELLCTLGELPETAGNVTFYVDGVNGDDINGLGNSTLPFASVPRALEALRTTVIKHTVRILVLNPTAGVPYTYTLDSTWYLEHDIQDQGSLSIIGVSAAEVAYGDEAISAVSALGVGGEYIDAALAGWDVNGWQGCWVVPQDGAAQSLANPIQQNTATRLYSYIHGTPPGVADTIQGWRPMITVELNRLRIKTKCMNKATATGLKSPVAIVNLNLDFSGSTDAVARVDIDGIEQYIWLDFVGMIFSDAHVDDIKIKNAFINRYEPTDSALAVQSQTNIGNIGSDDNAGFSARRVTKDLDFSMMAFCENARIYHMCLTESIYHRGNYSGLILSTCAFNELVSAEGSYIETRFNFLSNVGGEAYLYQNTNAKIWGDYIQAGARVVVADNTRLFIGGAAQCDPLTAGYGLEAGPGTTCVIDATLAAFVGASGAIEFTCPNPNVVTAWPGAGALVSDALISAWAAQEG